MKKKGLIIIALSLFLRINIVYAEPNYFSNKELIDVSGLNSAQMQNIVQAVAEQYLNKQTLTDYEQKAMDVGDDIKTFNFRNFNMTPFDISRSNPNNFDCSSFVTNVYMNSFGFSFIDYYASSTIPTTLNHVKPNDNKISPLLDKNITKLSTTEKEQKIGEEYENLKNSLLYSGKGISTGILEKVAKDTNNGPTSLTPFVWNNLNGDKDTSKTAINKLISNVYNTLQTGDILLVRKIGTDGKTKSGHVLLYVKEHYTSSKDEWSEGFIHSQGKDYPMDTFNFINTESYGEDSYSVRYIKKNCYVEDCTPNDGKTTGLNFIDNTKTKVYFVAVLRPINVIKTGKYKNIYNYKYNTSTNSTSQSKKTTKEVYRLANYFADKNNLSMQQYLYNKTKGKRIYNTNTIKSGEEIYIKYYFYNKSNKNLTFNIQFSPTNNGNKNLYIDPASETNENNKKNYFYYSTKDNDDKYATVKRTFENNIVTMKITLSPRQSIHAYYKLYYKNLNNTKETLTFNGLKVYLSDTIDNNKLISFNKMSVNAIGGKYKEAIKNEYGNIMNYYYTNKVKKPQTQKDSIYNLFNISSNPQQIINTLFSECNKNYYYGINCSNQNNTNSNSEKQKLKAMVVEGMYGGIRVRGNTDNSRIRRISFDYLEAGDIIVGCKYNAYCQTIVYNGKKTVTNNKTNETKQEDITFTQLYNSKEGYGTIYHLEKTSKNNLMNILTYDAFVVLRPLREMQYSSILLSQVKKEENKTKKPLATLLANENGVTADEGLDENTTISNIEDNITDTEEDEVPTIGEDKQMEEISNEDENDVYESNNEDENDTGEEQIIVKEEQTEEKANTINKDKNITVNPPTGTITYIIVLVIMSLAFTIAFYYFKKKQNKGAD